MMEFLSGDQQTAIFIATHQKKHCLNSKFLPAASPPVPPPSVPPPLSPMFELVKV